MAFIEVDLGGVKEAEAVPEGTYDLRVAAFDLMKSKKGNDMYKAVIVIEDGNYPNAKPISEYLTLPGRDHDEAARAFLLRQIKRFLAVFGVPFEANGFNDEDVVGATGNCLVVQDEPDENGEVWNSVRAPRLKDDEGVEEKAQARRPARRRA